MAAPATRRTTVPVVAARGRRRRWNGLKVTLGLGVLVLVAVVCAAAGWASLRSLSEGDGRSAVDAYLDGDGVRYDSVDGRFRALLPESPEERASRIELADGPTDITGVQASLGDDRKVRISWIDLESAPSPEAASFVLPSIAVFVGEDIGATPTKGALREGTDQPTYDFVLELPIDADAGATTATTVDARLVLVGARVYLLRVEGPDVDARILDQVAVEFEPRTD